MESIKKGSNAGWDSLRSLRINELGKKHEFTSSTNIYVNNGEVGGF